MRARTSLLGLSTALILVTTACVDSPTGPAGGASFPQAAKTDNGKGGGGGTTIPVSAALAGGMMAAAQPVDVVSSNRNRLEIGTGGAPTYVLSTGFAGATDCATSVPDANATGLFDRLVDGFAGGRYLNATVDRRALGAASSGHQVGTTWTAADGRFYSLWVSDAVVSEPSAGVYVYAGGRVHVKDRTDSSGEHVTLTCRNGDDVTLTTEGV